jgi:hypothetical protein
MVRYGEHLAAYRPELREAEPLADAGRVALQPVG